VDVATQSGQNVTGLSFGSFQAVSISGVVFDDLAGDGLFNTGDTGQAGRTVFLDANGNGRFDTGEASVTSGADGSYQFTNLGPGTYQVLQVIPAGYLGTATPVAIQAASGVNRLDINLGTFKQFALRGQVFRDLQGDGVFQPGEPAFPGVGVRLLRYVNGVQVSSVDTISDAAGNYQFTGLIPGVYAVNLQGATLRQTTSAVLISGKSGTDVTGVNVGAFEPISISGRVFTDRDGNGNDNSGFDPGLGGAVVTLARDANGNGQYDPGLDPVGATATTGGDGRYTFSSVGPGTYVVAEGRIAGRLQTTPAGAYVVTATSGGNVFGRDFGNLAGVNQSYVYQLYRDLLGRTVDPAGLQTWSSQLDAGTPRNLVVQAIQGSLEYRTKLVNDTYFLLLGRRADPQGMQSGLNVLASLPLYIGAAPGLEQLKLRLLSSTEYFQNRGGNSNVGYVNALFQDILGRPADNFALVHFGGLLAGGLARASLARIVLESVEGTERLVNTLYQRYLHRAADRRGLDTFGFALRQGTREEDVVLAFVTSNEYVNGL
jgi:protocatechuate 3,4-dioxygenase beta subunit